MSAIPAAKLNSNDEMVVSTDPFKDIELNSTITSKPVANYAWFRNGAEIVGETLRNLKITSADKQTHDGLYTVIASNYLGTITSAPIGVNINSPPTEVKVGQVYPTWT